MQEEKIDWRKKDGIEDRAIKRETERGMKTKEKERKRKRRKNAVIATTKSQVHKVSKIRDNE